MKLLFEHHAEGRSVRVFEDRAKGSRLYVDGRALYTHVNAVGDNLLHYIEEMANQLYGRPEVLLLGAAGGALATRLSRRGATVTAVDNWLTAFEIARKWFHLPAEVICVHADALDFLRSTRQSWPAIAIDVFDREKIPNKLITVEFGAALSAAIEPGGVVVWNVADSARSAPVRRIETILRRQGWATSQIAVLPGNVGNTLVLGRAPMSR